MGATKIKATRTEAGFRFDFAPGTAPGLYLLPVFFPARSACPGIIITPQSPLISPGLATISFGFGYNDSALLVGTAIAAFVNSFSGLVSTAGLTAPLQMVMRIDVDTITAGLIYVEVPIIQYFGF